MDCLLAKFHSVTSMVGMDDFQVELVCERMDEHVLGPVGKGSGHRIHHEESAHMCSVMPR